MRRVIDRALLSYSESAIFIRNQPVTAPTLKPPKIPPNTPYSKIIGQAVVSPGIAPKR